MFTVGEVYRRRDLHKVFGGQDQVGISTPANHAFIMLFMGERGKQHGYDDGWTASNMLHYVGEGQRGDQQFMRGNRAIRDHMEQGKDLHVFQYVRQGHVEYVGRFVYAGHHTRTAPDTQGNPRQVIVFELKRLDD